MDGYRDIENRNLLQEETSDGKTVLLTLPISCQICLGKVKVPVVCSNQHVFCKQCLVQWNKKCPYCPACRVPINETNPFKKILGSMDEASQEQNNDPTLKSQLRRTRLKMLYDEFHNEIDYLEEKLMKYTSENKGLKTENDHLRRQLEESELKLIQNSHETSRSEEDRNMITVDSSSNGDINTILKISNKLQEMITLNESITQMNTALRKELRNCRAERDLYIEDFRKLKEEFNFPQANQKYNACTVAALELKVENYEKEIALLKKALKNNDPLPEELRTECQNFTGNRWMSRDKAVTSPFSNLSASEALKKFVMSTSDRQSPLTEPILAEWDRTKTARGFIKRILADANHEHQNTRLESSFSGSPTTPHSNHMDSHRFPACAKLIELTKGRTDQNTTSNGGYTEAAGRLSGSSLDSEKLVNKSDEGDTITVVIPSSDQTWPSNRDWKFHSTTNSHFNKQLNKDTPLMNRANGLPVNHSNQNEREQNNYVTNCRQSPTSYADQSDEQIIVVNPDTREYSDSTLVPVKKIKLEDS